MRNAIAESAIDGFLTPFRMVRDIFRFRNPLGKQVDIGYVDETQMAGDTFGKIDEIRDALERFSSNCNKIVVYNRLYLNVESIQLNFSIDKQKYLVTVFDDGYEIAKTNKKTTQLERHRVDYDQIKDGSFLELFAK